MSKSRQLRRRGANAIEFALVSPILFALMVGTVDYGWYFFNEWFVMGAIQEAARLGAMKAPAAAEVPGACVLCVTTTTTEAVTRLANQGITVADADVTPTIVNVSGVCALSLNVAIPHSPLIGLVPVPSNYIISGTWFLNNVTGC